MNNDTLKVELEAGNTNQFLTNMLFRDTSAWYHVVVTFDSTNGTQANRVKIYVNGVDQSGTGGGGFSQQTTLVKMQQVVLTQQANMRFQPMMVRLSPRRLSSRSKFH